LRRLTEAQKQWDFGLCFYFSRNKKGFKWNHKRVYRISHEFELNLRIKPRSRIKRDKPETLAVPSEINQVWSMDFMSDFLKNGRSIRTFNVIDDFNRESLAIDRHIIATPARYKIAATNYRMARQATSTSM